MFPDSVSFIGVKGNNLYGRYPEYRKDLFGNEWNIVSSIINYPKEDV